MAAALRFDYLEPQTTHKQATSPTMTFGLKPISMGTLRIQVTIFTLVFFFRTMDSSFGPKKIGTM